MTAPADDSKTYRIIGIRADDSRQVIVESVSESEATDIFMKHMESGEFKALNVERE